MTHKAYDTAIIGGGIMGSATAYSLMQDDSALKVAVIEMDPSYTRASTTLSMANARIQFSIGENIRISQYAFEVLENFDEMMAVGDNKPDVTFRREGNLFLADENGRAYAEKGMSLQQSLGCQIE